MASMDDKLRQMEDEMSRFEAEISGASRPVIGVNTYNQVQQKLQSDFSYASAAPTVMPVFGNLPPPPPPPPLLIPQQVTRNANASFSTPAQVFTPVVSQPAVVTATPKLYTAKATPVLPTPVIIPAALNIPAIQAEVEKKLKKLKTEKPSIAAEVAISQGKASSALQSFGSDEHKRNKKGKKIIRTAGGTTWEDPTLLDWDEDDFRLFCGDLGNDVTDELLIRTFNKYPSFQRARVVRDKRTNKSKGYGFISFKDPSDFIKAMKEMNGRYVGSRPIKLRKSCWKNRNLDVVRKKEKEKAALISLLTSGNNAR